MRAGADRLDPQVTSDLALVLAVVGEGCVGDLQVENADVLVADQAQSRMAHDLAVCKTSCRQSFAVLAIIARRAMESAGFNLTFLIGSREKERHYLRAGIRARR